MTSFLPAYTGVHCAARDEARGLRYVTLMRDGIHDRANWVKLLIGFAILFAVLQGTAAVFQSMRGEAGLYVAAATLATALLVQRVLFSSDWRKDIGLGLGIPRARGIVAAIGVSLLALCVIPVFQLMQSGGSAFYPGAAWLAAGIFLQGGVAEEIVFRGYLYGHIRRGRGFWRAALISAVPFAAAHLYLFAVMDWTIALTALALSVALSFPFAKLYEMGGRTIWAPAIAHAVVQGAVKLIVIEAPEFPIAWMVVSLVAMWVVFLISSSADSRS